MYRPYTVNIALLFEPQTSNFEVSRLTLLTLNRHASVFYKFLKFFENLSKYFEILSEFDRKN